MSGLTVGRTSAFTMVEIAISLAIIGFALVAIIGILPSGMNVQKENREETIINQDASVFMDAIRNGTQGLDDLTNVVLAITNYVTEYHYRGARPQAMGTSVRFYTYTSSSTMPPLLLSNGYHIVGLLSTPKYIPWNFGGRDMGFYSNHVVAVVRSISGAASEKFPQTNADVNALAFGYRLVSEVVPYAFGYYDNTGTFVQPPMPYCGYDTNWASYVGGLTTNSPYYLANLANSNYARVAANLAANLRDVRLTFRWPLYPNGKVGNGRQVFVARCSSSITNTIELPPTLLPAAFDRALWFMQPATYAKGSL